MWQVIETLRQNDNSVGATAEYLAIPAEKVRAALRYYDDHQEEIDAWVNQARAMARREEGELAPAQERLG